MNWSHVAPRMGLSLALVSLGLCGLFMLIKYSKFNTRAQKDNLKVISSLSIGPKEKLLIVHWENMKILLGVTGQQINMIQSIERPKRKQHLTTVALEKKEFEECLIKEQINRV